MKTIQEKLISTSHLWNSRVGVSKTENETDLQQKLT